MANGVHIEGQTNLPDGTELMVSFQRGPVVGGEKLSVSNGHFSEDVLPKAGKSIPPGKYDLEISTPLGDLQPDDVKAQLGSDYEALTGPLLRKGVIGERGIDYTSSVHIGGAIDAKADLAARREALQQVKEADERDCPARPDLIEKYTGAPMLAEARERAIKECFAQSARIRAKFSKEPLPRQ
jgi:hypothetical protein